MARSVSKGERLRIEASDWNAVMAMVRDWSGVRATGPSLTTLPCTTAVLRSSFQGVRRPVWGEVVSLYQVGVSFTQPIPATLPLEASWQPSPDESELFRFARLDYQLLTPRPFTDRQTADLHQPFAVCIHPRTMTFAISGMAIVRVRFHSRWHRYVRRPILLPGEGGISNNDPDVARYTGVLDSSGSGPGQIVGAFMPAAADGATPPLVDSHPWPFVGGEDPRPVVWALIRW